MLKNDNKDEYISRITEMNTKIDLTQEILQKQKEELSICIKEYADKFAQFKPGTKVKVTTPAHKVYALFTNAYEMIPKETRYGFVDHNEVLEDLSIKPVLFMCKKDGTRSKKRLYYSCRDILEKA